MARREPRHSHRLSMSISLICRETILWKCRTPVSRHTRSPLCIPISRIGQNHRNRCQAHLGDRACCFASRKTRRPSPCSISPNHRQCQGARVPHIHLPSGKGFPCINPSRPASAFDYQRSLQYRNIGVPVIADIHHEDGAFIDPHRGQWIINLQ
jgi:hypothetical protein